MAASFIDGHAQAEPALAPGPDDDRSLDRLRETEFGMGVRKCGTPGAVYFRRRQIDRPGEEGCALRPEGDGFGQAGAPRGLFNAIAAGGNHSCGLRPDETITCWGLDHEGQASAPPGRFSAVAAGGNHSCGLRPDETVTCWGGGTIASSGVGWD